MWLQSQGSELLFGHKVFNILKKLRFGVLVSYVSHSDVVVILYITLRLMTRMKEKRTNDQVIFQ